MITSINKKWKEQISKVYEAGQEHVFRFWADLSDSQRENLIIQISAVDFDLMKELTDQARNSKAVTVSDKIGRAHV